MMQFSGAQEEMNHEWASWKLNLVFRVSYLYIYRNIYIYSIIQYIFILEGRSIKCQLDPW